MLYVKACTHKATGVCPAHSCLCIQRSEENWYYVDRNDITSDNHQVLLEQFTFFYYYYIIYFYYLRSIFYFCKQAQIVPNEQRMRPRKADQFLCFTRLYLKGDMCYLVKQKGLHVGPLDKHTFPEKTRTRLHFNLLEEAWTASSWTV